MAEHKPVRIVLTPEQQAAVKRISGQHIDAIELQADDPQATGGPLKFLWRISAATGIPRQAWASDDKPEASASDGKTAD